MVKKNKPTSTVVHQGRAANCACKDTPGPRCPDCNHLLTGEAKMVQFGEGSIEHSEIQCVVCGRRISDEKLPRGIRLTVQDAKQISNSKI